MVLWQRLLPPSSGSAQSKTATKKSNNPWILNIKKAASSTKSVFTKWHGTITHDLTGFTTNLNTQKARDFALTGIISSSVLLVVGNRTRQVWFFHIIPGVRCHMETYTGILATTLARVLNPRLGARQNPNQPSCYGWQKPFFFTNEKANKRRKMWSNLLSLAGIHVYP